MLNDLIRITSTEPYQSDGGMKVKEISITPWDSPDAKFVFDILIDAVDGSHTETWEVKCTNLAQTDGIPQALIPTTEIKLFDDHPVLWHLDDEVFFSITSKANNIAALMGDLFIEHSNACGNWVDFQWLYDGLPVALDTLGENQLSIPVRLKDSCFKTLKKHGVNYTVNTIQENEKGFRVLFFSNIKIWPDEKNFGQPYIIAQDFSERRLS